MSGMPLSTRRYAVWTNPNVEFYHGTRKEHPDAILKNGIDPSRSAPNTDFGRGFYTSTNRAQAEIWARMKACENGDVPVVLKLTIDRDALSKLRSLSFVLPNPDF